MFSYNYLTSVFYEKEFEMSDVTILFIGLFIDVVRRIPVRSPSPTNLTIPTPTLKRGDTCRCTWTEPASTTGGPIPGYVTPKSNQMCFATLENFELLGGERVFGSHMVG
jgi:hypothetical protein